MFGKDTVWNADMAKSPMGNLRKLAEAPRKAWRPHPTYWPMPTCRLSIIHSYLTSKSTNSIPTCFADARAVFAEARLQKIAKRWHGGSSRKQIIWGRIRGSCGCVRGSYAEGFAEVRPYVQQSKKEFLTPLICLEKGNEGSGSTPWIANFLTPHMLMMFWFALKVIEVVRKRQHGRLMV